MVPLNTGTANVSIEVPIAPLPLSNPTAVTNTSIGRNSTAAEDPITAEFAVFGSSGLRLSANSTNTVSAATYNNSWSSRMASGQYYLSNTATENSFEIVLANPWLATDNPE